jgi:hypothetical protein
LRYLTLCVTVALWADPSPLHSQGCCTAGSSSLGGFENGAQTYRTLTFSANYQYTSLKDAYQQRERIDDPLRRTAEVAYFTVQADYGIQPRLSLLASIYYSDKNRELTVESGQSTGGFVETVKFRGSGIGDMTLMGKYQAVRPTITAPFGLALGGGATIPTGSYTEEQDGSQLSIDLQPGTGAVSLIGWLLAGYSFPEAGIGLSLMGLYRYSTANLDGYRVGDEININLAVERGLGEHLAASLVLRSRFGMRDYVETRFLGGTGGTFHDVMPGLSYVDGPSIARVFGQIPLYRNVSGIQLTPTYLLGVEYSYTIDFRDVVDVIVPEL